MSKPHPEKIYLEPTTRCNLRCRMCVKYAPGNSIEEMNMDPSLFAKLIPALPTVRRVIINGIGEPLMHPQLDQLIGLLHNHLSENASIGLQSNGYLLNRDRAETLLAAGLETVCLSLDTISEHRNRPGKQLEHTIGAVRSAIHALRAAEKRQGLSCRIGLETVVDLDNFEELPDIVDWATRNNLDFIIVTHLFHYVPSLSDLFTPHPPRAIDFFARFQELAAAQQIDLRSCLDVFRTFDRSPGSLKALAFLNNMHREAAWHDIQLHPASLIEHQEAIDRERVLAVFAAAQKRAASAGLILELPPLEAHDQPCCRFIEDQATCIAADGSVMPCHFLWHRYSCLIQGRSVAVVPRIFGSLRDQDLLTIWNGASYRNFREEASAYGYASCWSCPQGPCPDLVNASEHFEANDCYGSTVPCGHCQWSLGGIRCLS